MKQDEKRLAAHRAKYAVRKGAQRKAEKDYLQLHQILLEERKHKKKMEMSEYRKQKLENKKSTEQQQHTECALRRTAVAKEREARKKTGKKGG